MRIALDFACDWDPRGGVWRYGISLARALNGLLPPRSVSIPCFERLPAERVDELRATGAEVVATGLQTRLDLLRSMAASRPGQGLGLRKCLARGILGTPARRWLLRRGLVGADVLHSLFVPRERVRRVARVGTVQDLIPLLVPEYPPVVVERFQRFLDAFRRDDCPIIVPSEATKRDLVEHAGIATARVRVIHYGIDRDQFHPDGTRTGAVLDRYGLRPGGYFLYVGSFDRRKNLDTLVEAYLTARARFQVTLPLVLTGAADQSSPESTALVRRIRSELEPFVRYIDFAPDPDLADLYRGARASVLVSLYEGFGFPPLESMACGTPAIVSDRSSLPEVVGTAGLIVAPGDRLAIAKALSDLERASSLHGSLREEGLARVAGFTWEASARATLEVYREALARQRFALCVTQARRSEVGVARMP